LAQFIVSVPCFLSIFLLFYKPAETDYLIIFTGTYLGDKVKLADLEILDTMYAFPPVLWDHSALAEFLKIITNNSELPRLVP